ncbi:MAG: hypothetical protein CL677_10705 [Bdellovibrionaceae bacterium]|nr:hypothetical protein [Pseudobdellovibrionaceae bacterium]
MTKYLIALYILIVLTIAGTVRAHTVITTSGVKYLSIDPASITFNEDTYALYISGDLSVGCDQYPKPLFTPTEDRNTVILKIFVQDDFACTSQQTGFYDLVFDLRSQLQLNDIRWDESLKIKIGETGEVITIDPVNFDGSFPFFDTVLEGQLISNGLGQYYLLVELEGSTVAYQLQLNEPMNVKHLENYLNEYVSVSGYVFEYSVPDLILKGSDRGMAKTKSPRLWVSGLSSSLP